MLARARVLLPVISGIQEEAGELISAGQPPLPDRCHQRPDRRWPAAPVDGRPPGHRRIDHSTWPENEICEHLSDDRLDYALFEACAGSVPAAPGVVWQPVAVDAVWMLLCDRHPLAGRAEIALAEPAEEQWVLAPGGRLLRRMRIGCLRTCRIRSEEALCQGTMRDLPGAVAVPLADTPLRWQHLLGWDPGRRAATTATG